MEFDDEQPPNDAESEAMFNDIYNLHPVAQVAFHPVDITAERATYTAPVVDHGLGEHDGTREGITGNIAAYAAAAHDLTLAEQRMLPIRRDEARLIARFGVPPAVGAGRPDQMVGDAPPLMLDEPRGGVGGLRLNDFWLQADFPRLAYPAVWLEDHMYREGFINAAAGHTFDTAFHPIYIADTYNHIPGAFRRAMMDLAREGRVNIDRAGAALFWGTQHPDDVQFTDLAIDPNLHVPVDAAVARLVGAQFGGAHGMRWRRFHAVFRDAFDRAMRDHEFAQYGTAAYRAADDAMEAVARYAIEHNIHVGGGTPRFVTREALRLNDRAVLEGGTAFSLAGRLREFFDPGGGSMGSM